MTGPSSDSRLIESVSPRYDVRHEVGRGGFGVVYDAYDRTFVRKVAIKQLFASDHRAKERFRREAQVLSVLSHPHNVQVYDYYESEDLCLMIMEWLAGGTVRALLKGGEITAETACEIILAACAGLYHAHQHGVLHRDMKPENLMFHESGVLKVTDFGIAKVLAGDSPTSTSVPAGLTPAYASPEQLRGLKELTPASDVYSTGTVLYELLSRRLPFPTDIDLAAMVYKKVFEEPTDLRVVASDVPFPIADVVMRCLATEPTDRYPQAEAFGLALAAAATEAWGRSFLYPAGPILQAKRPIAILEDADRRPPPVVVSGAPNGSTLARALTAPARDRARPAPPGGSSQGATVTPDRPSARPAPHPGAHRGGRWAAALAVAIVAVLSAGLVWVAVRPTPGPASRPPPSPSPTATAPPGTALPEPGTDWVAYDFDQQPLGIAGATRQFPDTSGHGNDGVVRVLPPGLITVTAHDGHGHAIKFPDPCIAAPESACPRAVVQTADPSELNARDRDFTYGVAVLVQPTEAIPGATIVQKGRAGRRDSSQWKLQLETGGRISCVVVVQGSGAAYRALSTVTVADGGWHDVTCTRRGAELTIEVDASQPGRATLPPGLVFENDAPLRLGGNSIAVDNDQYSGALDNVFFRLGGS